MCLHTWFRSISLKAICNQRSDTDCTQWKRHVSFRIHPRVFGSVIDGGLCCKLQWSMLQLCIKESRGLYLPPAWFLHLLRWTPVSPSSQLLTSSVDVKMLFCGPWIAAAVCGGSMMEICHLQGWLVVAVVIAANSGVCLQRYPLSVSGGLPATEPLRRGLNELNDVCQHVLNTFQVRTHAGSVGLR